MGTADAMISAATAALGYKEGRNNDTHYGRWYGLNFNPWCDMAVSKWGADSGNAAVVGRFAYCPSHVNWFKARGQWHGRNVAAKRGDVVFFSWDGGPVADHVGIVTEDAAPGESVRTIEGNTSSGSAGSQDNGDGVYRRTRNRSVILGFGRPAYDQPRPRYAVFPGADWFKRNPRSPIVTAMGRRLVAEGCGRYASGPGPQWTEADRLSYAAWQRRRGFGGSDADGWPGKSTWDALRVPQP
ncbi:peptidoglycan-binding protein [Streptomyces sp. NPDC056488]|uniref:peptidoglycan-binding protein n=1 Tax=Streptomyces sp. NPDC056488 TaxID=3345836 RepID=UPI0036CF1209